MDDSRIRAIAETAQPAHSEPAAAFHDTNTGRQAFSTEDDVEKDIAEDYTPKMEL